MDDFGMLAKDFGFRPQGKSAPMKSSGGDRRSRNASSSTTFSADGNDMFNDVFGGPPKYTNNNSKSTSSMSDFDYDSIFKDSASTNNNEAKTKPTSSNSPVYDKPVYDDDIFDGLPGMKSKPISSSSSGRYDDNIFASMTTSPPKPSPHSDHFEDLFGNLGRTEKAEPNKHQSDKSPKGLDDLIPGFGSGSPASSNRWNSDPSPKSSGKTKEKSNAIDDPFVVLESISTPVPSFTDPLEDISKFGKSRSTKAGAASASGDLFSDIDSLNGFPKSAPASAKETNNMRKGPKSPSEEGSSIGSARSSEESSSQPLFDTPNISRTSPFDQTTSPASHNETNSQAGMSPQSDENDIWLTVSEIPLFTPVTRAPPPSRTPPPIPRQVDRDEQTIDEEITQKLEKEKMKEIEREKAKQTVERVTREARERAASEARLKSERAAVQRAQAEARERAALEAKGRAERAEKAAAQKAEKEAKEKSAAQKAEKEAKEKSAAQKAEKEAKEKSAAQKAEKEAKERAAAEKAAVAKVQADARRRAERAAVERVTAEARERAAAEARERAAAATAAATAAKVNQQKNETDLDSFFSMTSRPSSVPRSRTTSDSATDQLSQDTRAPEGGTHRASASAGAPSNVRKASSTTNFVDDLSSIFGGSSPGGEFQEVEGETEERRRARLERQQRTQERAAKALAEKNQRDMQSQKEQEEKHRISATLDVEIKRWAAGKEGNLRAMLSTLQYVLWPECGWQAVSLTDLITGASVKKAYRKATLCIHPDKVQQKGANLQQKYVAEKVFDLLKEAWNKFNSEELF